jgi:hypothetical protein
MDEIGGAAAELGKHDAPAWPPAKDARGTRKRVLTPFLPGNWQRAANAGVQFPGGNTIDQQGDPQPSANYRLQPVGPVFRTPPMLDQRLGLGQLYYQ